MKVWEIIGRFTSVLLGLLFALAIVIIPPYLTGHEMYLLIGGETFTGFWGITGAWLFGAITLACATMIVMLIGLGFMKLAQILMQTIEWIIHGGE